MQQLTHGDALAAWCVQWLGARPTRLLFEVAHLSLVTGLRLSDGRAVVVKARSALAYGRIAGLLGGGVVD